MVRTILHTLSREVRGLHEAAYVLGAFAIGSQLLALIRDRLLASSFGAGTTLDVYYAAFRVPDLIFAGIASLVSFSILIPFLAGTMRDDPRVAQEFLSHIFSAFFITIVVLSLIVWIAAPQILTAVFPGIAGTPAFVELVLLTRILLAQPILLGISNLIASITQLKNAFILYAISPILYNAGIIFGIYTLEPVFGIAGLGFGVVLGALLHVGIQIPFIVQHGMFPRLRIAIDWHTVSRVVFVAFPRMVALSAQQLVLLAMTGFASIMASGSIAVFNLAYNLYNVPLSIIGASYSVAAFPTLSRLYARGEHTTFGSHIITAARHILFWSVPVIVLFIVLRAQIVRVIFGVGAFDWTDTRLTAAALALFAIALTAHAFVLLLVRAAYAAGKTKIPLYANVVGAVVALGGAYGMTKIFALYPGVKAVFESLLRVTGIPGTDVLALPLGYTLGICTTVLILACARPHRTHVFRPLLRSIAEIGIASGVVGVVAYEVLQLIVLFFDTNTVIGIFGQGFVAGITGICAGLIVLYAFGNTELAETWRAFHQKFWRRAPVATDATELS